MSIWSYAHEQLDKEWLRKVTGRSSCAFCGEELKCTTERSESGAISWTTSLTTVEKLVRNCQVCGWWSVLSTTGDIDENFDCQQTEGAAGILGRFDVSNATTPVEEICAYLTGKPEARFHLNPQKVEPVVADVFRNLGFRVEETQYSKDSGIDAVLYDSEGAVIPIQVKAPRSGKPVQVNLIREFLGAMIIGGKKDGVEYTCGAFVTMSRSTRGAAEAVENCSIPIEPYDAKRFFDVLRIAQRTRTWGVNEKDAPFRKCSMITISERRDQLMP